MIENNQIKATFSWLNKPDFAVRDNRLFLYTSPETDFWQRTHYGFQRDNGHCLLTPVAGDFTMTARTEFYPQHQYDQCGLMIRNNSENWIKVSTEYEDPSHARLGSVVTNLGYSDWATIDLFSEVSEMWYRVQREHNDFFIQYSYNGNIWYQLRVAHLLEPAEDLQVGVYACSPKPGSFRAIFDNFELEQKG